MLKTVYKKSCKAFVAAWAIEAQKRHDSQEAYFVNGQASFVYLKMFKIFLSLIRLFSVFTWFYKYCLSAKCLLTNAYMKNGKSALKLQ